MKFTGLHHPTVIKGRLLDGLIVVTWTLPEASVQAGFWPVTWPLSDRFTRGILGYCARDAGHRSG